MFKGRRWLAVRDVGMHGRPTGSPDALGLLSGVSVGSAGGQP